MNSQNRSDDQELVSKNLELIISSSNYQLAHEDRELLNSDETVSYTHLTLPTNREV